MSECCGDAPEPTADQTGDLTSVRTGQPLTELSEAERARLAGLGSATWPYLQPAWLAATEGLLAGAKPWHSVARRADGEFAFLPGFLLDAPSLVDADPRTYLGWEPATGEAACCGVPACCDATGEIEALGAAAFFPALVLGSPLGYRSEAVSTVDDPLLVADLVDQVVPDALAAGVRTVVAPWIADRPDNAALRVALHAHGAGIAFWGEDNRLPLVHGSYQEHLAALPSRKRKGLRRDRERAAAGVDRIERRDGADLLPLLPRIAELTCLNRQRHDGAEGPAEIRALLGALLAEDVPVRGYLAFRGESLVASSVGIRQGDALLMKWAGFDYAALGERSGLYFELGLDRPLADAYDEGLAAIEYGPGADQAKRLRGAQPRAVATALLVADPVVRPRMAALQAEFGAQRQRALGAELAADAEPEPTGGLSGRLLNLLRTPEDSGGCC